MCGGLSTAPGTEQDQHLAVFLMVLIILYILTILIILTSSCSHQSRRPLFHPFTVPPVKHCGCPARDAECHPQPPLLGWSPVPPSQAPRERPGDHRRLTRSRAKLRTTYSARVSVFTSVILMSPYMSESSGQYREHFTWRAQGAGSAGSSLPPRLPRPLPRGPTYPAHLHQFGDHDDAGTVLLPHHAPEVVDHLRLWPWGAERAYL